MAEDSHALSIGKGPSIHAAELDIAEGGLKLGQEVLQLSVDSKGELGGVGFIKGRALARIEAVDRLRAASH